MSQPNTDTLDYMHIGASRAASCWVWENIRDHPELHNPTGKKNVRYWNRKLEKSRGAVRHGIKSLDNYKANYQRINGKLNIDMTDSNSWISKEQVQEVFETYPDVKVSYCFRNPVETMWSHTHRKVDNTTPVKFMNLLATNRKVKTVEKQAKMVSGKLLPYRCNVDYRENYNKWSQHTDLHVILFDDIKHNPKNVLISIADFIGIDNTFWDKSEQNNQSKQVTNKTPKKSKITEKYAQILIDELSDEITFMEELFSRDFSHWRSVENYDTLDPNAQPPRKLNKQKQRYKQKQRNIKIKRNKQKR